MGSLNPGATYIYEREHGQVWAREFGQTDRRLIGWDVDSPELRRTKEVMNQILGMCETDPAMKDLLDRLMVLYNLKKNNE